MTQKEKGMYEQYMRRNEGTLYEAYGRMSEEKRRSWRAIEKECYEYGGHGLHVCAHSSWAYSCGFLYNDPETGAERLRYYTASNTYDFEVEER